MKASTLSDEEDMEVSIDGDQEISGNFVAFTASVSESTTEPGSDSNHEDVEKLPYEELETSYLQLYKKWEFLLKVHNATMVKNSILEKNIKILKDQLAEKDDQLSESSSKSNSMIIELETLKK